jgi:hypothetical protein
VLKPYSAWIDPNKIIRSRRNSRGIFPFGSLIPFHFYDEAFLIAITRLVPLQDHLCRRRSVRRRNLLFVMANSTGNVTATLQ